STVVKLKYLEEISSPFCPIFFAFSRHSCAPGRSKSSTAFPLAQENPAQSAELKTPPPTALAGREKEMLKICIPAKVKFLIRLREAIWGSTRRTKFSKDFL